MDDDIDFDDLLGEGRHHEPAPPAQQPTSAGIPKPADLPDLSTAPSERELALARQIRDLQGERDALKAEVSQLRASASSASTGPTPPAASEGAEASITAAPSEPITIPHDILPVLSILRKHIAELSRDNAALRYVFMGGPSPSSGSAAGEGNGGVLGKVTIEGAQGVKLEQIVTRVRELVQENEELGALVMSLGKASEEEWQQALAESRAVIESLDADLTQHLATIQDLRSQLEDAKRSAKSAPKGPSGAPEAARGPSGGPSSRSNDPPSGSGQRNAPLIRPHHNHRPSSGGSGSGAGSSGQRQMGMGILGAASARPGSGTGSLGLPDRDKRRDRDRDSQSSGMSGGAAPRGGESRSGQNHRDDRGHSHPQSHAGAGSGRRDDRGGREGGGSGSKDPPRGPREDRDYKRRR